jgi:large subunit ribosomal protein L24
MNRLKKNDEVIVIAGKDKGRKGVITSVSSDKNRIAVEGINWVKKHTKPNPNKQIKGGIIKQTAALHASNVALYNPLTKKADRVGFKFIESGEKKVRYFKSNSQLVDL